MPVPVVAMMTPAIAGPTARAALTSTLLRVTALRRRPAPTISWAKDWRAGLSIAVMRPRPSASATIIQSSTAPVTVSTPSVSAISAEAGLGDDQQPALVHAVDQHAAVGREQQQGQELGGGHQPERRPRAGDLEHQPALGDGLHPGADRGSRPGPRSSGGSWPTRTRRRCPRPTPSWGGLVDDREGLERGQGGEERRDLVGGQLGQALDQHGGAAGAQAADQAPAGRGGAGDGAAGVRLVGRALDEAPPPRGGRGCARAWSG